MLKDKTAISGIEQTKFAKHLEDSELHLACETISLAFTGIEDEEVDALGSFTFEENDEFEITRNLGFEKVGEVPFPSLGVAIIQDPDGNLIELMQDGTIDR